MTTEDDDMATEELTESNNLSAETTESGDGTALDGGTSDSVSRDGDCESKSSTAPAQVGPGPQSVSPQSDEAVDTPDSTKETVEPEETDQNSGSDANFLTPRPGPDVTLEDIHGLADIKTQLRQELFESTENSDTQWSVSSVLLYGDAGVGKRRLAQAIAGEFGTTGYVFDYINTLDRDTEGDSPTTVREVISQAGENEPMAVIMDCFDGFGGIGPTYKMREKLAELRRSDSRVVIIGVVDYCNMHGDQIKAYFRSFDVRLEIEKSGRQRRQAAIAEQLNQVRQSEQVMLAPDIDTEQLAIATDGLYINDLRAVVRRSIQRVRSNTKTSVPTLSQEALLSVTEQIATEQFDSAAARFALQDVDVSKVDFDDIGGHESAKEELQRLLRQPLESAEVYEACGIPTNLGVLLHGPPGNGKTLLAKAVANNTGRTFIPIAGPELVNPFGTGTQRRLRELFEKARKNAPSVIFMDEFDSVGVQRGMYDGQKDEITNTLLTELDGLHSNNDVIVVAATNRIDALDEALLRPGRFEHVIEVGAPDESALEQIFAIHTETLPLAPDVTVNWLVNLVDDDLSGAHVAGLCNRAARLAIDRAGSDYEGMAVRRRDFAKAAQNIQSARKHQKQEETRRMYK